MHRNFPAVNSSNKTIDMPSAIVHMDAVVYHRDLIKQLLSKYLKLGEVEKRALFTHFSYPKCSFNLIIFMGIFACN